MKLFKNPVFAVVFCLLLIVGSTCWNFNKKMKEEYKEACNDLRNKVIDFAETNGLKDLESTARASLISGDYESMIDEYNINAVDYGKSETAAVDKAINNYISFLQKTDKFPVKQFISLFNISF